jgi:MFS family permease
MGCLVLGALLASVNASIVLISLPPIFRGIGLNPLAPGNVSYLLWMLMGYLLVSAVLVVPFGRLGLRASSACTAVHRSRVCLSVLTDAVVGATNVGPKIVCVETVPFAHRAATIGMTGGVAARGVRGALDERFQLERTA